MYLRDRRRWKAARTFTDLCELMAQWAEGKIQTWPGHLGEPDPETADLISTLAACNRSGYLTTCSQPGESAPEAKGLWEQRAAVMGFIADEKLLIELRSAAVSADLTVFIHGGDGRHGMGPKKGMLVTQYASQPCTGFGMKLDRRSLSSEWPGIHRDAYRAVSEAWQLTIVDPKWGRDDRLWPVLDQFSRRTATRTPAIDREA
jgi:hypothetical protein